MSRFALVIWLTTPLLIVLALAMMMDRSQGKPNPRLAAIAAARLPGQAEDSARDLASIERDIAETEARKLAMAEPGKGGAAAGSDAAKDGPKMAQPESLADGFTIIVEDKSKQASTDSPIYIASSHNGWNPGDQAMKLSRRSDMRWQIILPKPTLDSRMAFKFTRGSWDLVEVKADFSDIDNRLLPDVDVSKLAAGEKPVMNAYRPIKVGAGSVKRVEVVGGGGFVKNRDVIVWLPPGYDDAANAKKTYPVLYMQDGQNLFEKLPGLPAEWSADETAARLIAEKKIEPIIIVGIPHAGDVRMAEYTPIAAYDGVTPRGKEYIDFVINEVKPRVDRSFRTSGGPENTAIGGASLGGLIALEAATEHPNVFGKVLAESTPMLAKNRMAFTHFATKKNWPKMVYFGMGGKEAGTDPKDAGMNQQYAASAGAFGEALKGRGFSTDRMMIKVEPDAVHNEEAWAGRFGAALEFLFPVKGN